METKLTLKLEKNAISRGKKYALKKNTTLSKIVENYLLAITEEDNGSEFKISPLVKSLSGVIKVPDNYDSKKEYRDYIIKKYDK
jgi:hypothetical protein